MLTYLIQMIACSGVLYAYYHFFLRNEKFHQYNRFYLMAVMTASIVLPLFKWDVYPEASDLSNLLVQNITSYATLPEVVIAGAKANSYPSWLACLAIGHAGVMLLLLTRLVRAVMQIFKLRFSLQATKWNRKILIETTESGAPFTFFNWIFWNKNIQPASPEGQKMLRHEYYHAAQKHSIDILLAELVTAVCWFNPFFYLVKREMKTVHEFMADRYASCHENSLEYAEILVIQAMHSRHPHIVHPFFNNQLKRRITMLTTSEKTAWQWSRKLLVIPLFLLVASVTILRCKAEDKKEDTSTASENAAAAAIPPPAGSSAAPAHTETVMQPSKHNNTVESSKEPVSKNKNEEADREPQAHTKVQIDAKYPGNWRSFLEKKLNGNVAVDNGAKAGTYTTIIQFIVDLNGKVSDVKALTNVGYGMEDEAIRVIKQSGKWTPARMNGKPVKAYRKQPITFQISEA